MTSMMSTSWGLPTKSVLWWDLILAGGFTGSYSTSVISFLNLESFVDVQEEKLRNKLYYLDDLKYLLPIILLDFVGHLIKNIHFITFAFKSILKKFDCQILKFNN